MTNNVVNFLYLLCGFAINEKFKTEIFMSENNGILYLRIIPPKIIALLLIDHKNVITHKAKMVNQVKMHKVRETNDIATI